MRKKTPLSLQAARAATAVAAAVLCGTWLAGCANGISVGTTLSNQGSGSGIQVYGEFDIGYGCSKTTIKSK